MAVKYLPFYIYISKQFRDDCKYSSVMPPHKSLQFLDPTEIFKEFLPSSNVSVLWFSWYFRPASGDQSALILRGSRWPSNADFYCLDWRDPGSSHWRLHVAYFWTKKLQLRLSLDLLFQSRPWNKLAIIFIFIRTMLVNMGGIAQKIQTNGAQFCLRQRMRLFIELIKIECVFNRILSVLRIPMKVIRALMWVFY